MLPKFHKAGKSMALLLSIFICQLLYNYRELFERELVVEDWRQKDGRLAPAYL